MLRISETKVVQEQDGMLVLIQHSEIGKTDEIKLNESELREVIKFCHNALGIPCGDPFPYDY